MGTITTKNAKFTLDGVHKFKVGDADFDWPSNHFIGRVDPWANSGNHTLTVTLSGSNWTIGAFDAYTDQGGIKLVLKDSDSANNRHIKYLETDDAGSVITLKSTFVNDLVGNGGADKVTLGDQGGESVHLRGGNDTLIGRDGGCEFIGLGDGNNTYRSGDMWAGAVFASGGNDTFTVSGDGQAETLNAGSGRNTFNIAGNGWVGALVGGNGNDTVNVSTTNSVDSLYLGQGDNTLVGKGSGWIGSLVSYGGDDTVDLSKSTAQFAGAFWLGAGDNTMTTGTIFVSSIVSESGDDKIHIGSGGAGQVLSWGGNNDITSRGWIGSILTTDGNDEVRLLDGGVAFSVNLGDGEDAISVSEVTDANNRRQTCVFNGGKGNDEISFSAFTHSIDISLGDPSIVETGRGRFIVVDFENVTGGSAADRLEISYDGGKMTGGGGADTFVLADDDGKITVTDFSIAGGDKIDLSGLTGVDDFADLVANHLTQNGFDAEISDGNGNGLVLTNIDKDDLTSAQFDF